MYACGLSRRDERRRSLIRVILLTVVLWRIGLIVVPPIAIILQGIVKTGVLYWLE